MIAKVLKDEAKDKHDFNIAMNFCQKRINNFRSDEGRKASQIHHSCTQIHKRKCTGFGFRSVQNKLHKKCTSDLADNIKTMTAPPGVRSQYIKHLSLLVSDIIVLALFNLNAMYNITL